MKITDLSLTRPGEFVVGCNYWASHAGTAMWSNWQPDVVDADLKQLAGAGLQVLRVFPLWPDFQPLTLLRGGEGWPREFRFGEKPLPEDEAGQAGVSAEAIHRFAMFANLAEKHGLKLVVGLITGWMSGRLFAPLAFEGRNVLTDPLVIQWQVRFVRYFVRCFKGHPAILAWDLGNECNCMGSTPSSEAAWVWTAAIANAIRAEDASRPVVSGMHSLLPNRLAHWKIQHQAELTDVLTTHPYPIFTPHCDQDPVNTIRNGLHATAETRLYADIGGRPALVEETGTLGPMICSETVAAEFIRTVLFSSWAHDCHGLLWWCAYDQHHLENAPYDWSPIERELGLVRTDRSPKPALQAIGEFRSFLDRLPVRALPPRLTEAVCILTEGQDQWGAAYSSFILAKQAGFDLVFQTADQPLKQAELYLLPSVAGIENFTRRFWLDLEARVRAGATLYLSHKDCILSPFTEPFGLEIQTRQRRNVPADLTMDGLPGAPRYTVNAPIRLQVRAARAEVLGREADGNPAFTRAALGKGQVYFLSVPVEEYLTNFPGGFHTAEAQPFWKIYQSIARSVIKNRVVAKDNPMVGVTEHPLNEHERVVILINYSPDPAKTHCTLAPGWTVKETWYGAAPAAEKKGLRCSINANNAVVLLLASK